MTRNSIMFMKKWHDAALPKSLQNVFEINESVTRSQGMVQPALKLRSGLFQEMTSNIVSLPFEILYDKSEKLLKEMITGSLLCGYSSNIARM